MNSNSSKGKILVVDDTPATIGILSETLESEGFQVFIATSGDKAISRAENIQPDIILLDVMMPGLDGFETCARLKKIEKVKDIPILFMTGLSAIESKVKGFQAGAVDYVTKPIEIDEVLSRIKTHLALQNIQRQLLEKNNELQFEITERKNAEEKVLELNAHLEKRVTERTVELASVNRMLKMLSECNQALVRIDDEEELLTKISKIIVEFGGYPYVQVGFFQDNSLDKIRISTGQGFDYSDSAKEIVLPSDEVELLKGADFYQGKPFISNSLLEQTPSVSFSHVKDSHTFVYYIILPLVVEGKLIGFLKIFTDKMDSFHAEEVILLIELAGDLAFGIKLLNDRTELELAEKQLRENKILFDQVTAQSLVVVWSIDAHGLITFVSETCEEVWGYTPEELIGYKSYLDLFPEEDRDQVRSFGYTLKETRKTMRDIIYRINKKNGEIIWASTSAFPIFDMSGNFCGYRGSIVNITERKRMIDELIETKKTAEDANKLKDSLLSNMSHEFRTPLNGILGFAQLLEDEVNDATVVEMVRKISLSGKRLMNTLNSVLTLVEVERTDFQINIGVVDVTDICGQVKNTYQPLADEKGLSLLLNSDSPTVFSMSDDSLLRKLISYLVDNAIKYTPKGEVKIWIENEKNDDLNETTRIHIIDTGIGIKEEDRAVIFQEFRQASEGYKRAFEGIGLGLSLTQKIASLIHAEISLISQIGKGTEFIITLPKALEQNAIIPKLSKPITTLPTLPVEKKNDLEILLVEDNLLNIEVIKRFLKKKGNITSSQNGLEALELAAQNQYDVFLIDINLGHDIDGTEVLQQLRADDRYKSTPMIAITGYASETSKNEFLSKGFTGYLAKPFEKKELIALIDKLVHET